MKYLIWDRVCLLSGAEFWELSSFFSWSSVIKHCDSPDPQLGLCKCCLKKFLSNDICPFGDQIRMGTQASADSNFLLEKKNAFSYR